MKKVNMKKVMRKAHSLAKKWKKRDAHSHYSILLSIAMKQVWKIEKMFVEQDARKKSKQAQASKQAKAQEKSQAPKTKKAKNIEIINNMQELEKLAQRYNIAQDSSGRFQGYAPAYDSYTLARNLAVMSMNRNVHFEKVESLLEEISSDHDNTTAVYLGLDLLINHAYKNYIASYVENYAVPEHLISLEDISQELIAQAMNEFQSEEEMTYFGKVPYYTYISKVLNNSIARIVKRERVKRNGRTSVKTETYEVEVTTYNLYDKEAPKTIETIEIKERTYTTAKIKNIDKMTSKELANASYNESFETKESNMIDAIKKLVTQDDEKLILKWILEKYTVREIRNMYKEMFGKDCRRKYDKIKKRVREYISMIS